MSDFDKEVEKARLQHKQKKEELLAEYRKKLDRSLEEQLARLDIGRIKERIIKTTQEGRHSCCLEGVTFSSNYKSTKGFFRNRKVLYDFRGVEGFQKELELMQSRVDLLRRLKDSLNFSKISRICFIEFSTCYRIQIEWPTPKFRYSFYPPYVIDISETQV